MSLADTLVARALERVDLSYGATRDAYLRAVLPGDVDEHGNPSAQAVEMGSHQSSCLLFARGVLAADEVDGTIPWAGVPLDVLRCPYADRRVLGRVEALLLELARQRGLLVNHYDQKAMADIRPGDLLVIGYGGSLPKDPAERARHLAIWGGVAHGLMVTEVHTEQGGGLTVVSGDGGQRDPGNEGKPTAIRRVVRTLERRENGLWLANGFGRRRLNWRLRCPELPVRGA